MLNQEFCKFLEYEISKAFANSRNDQVNHFWCDGILLPPFESGYSKKFVNDNRKIAMTAFVGPTGQDEYELMLIFGNKALSKYARDLEITDCLTRVETNDWIDIERRKILIQLD